MSIEAGWFKPTEDFDICMKYFCLNQINEWPPKYLWVFFSRKNWKQLSAVNCFSENILSQMMFGKRQSVNNRSKVIETKCQQQKQPLEVFHKRGIFKILENS